MRTVSAALEAFLLADVNRHQIVVWLDPHDHYSAFVDALAALPRGRAIVFASGSRPTLIRTQPWMTSPHAERVRASIAAHDPQAQHTLNAGNAGDTIPVAAGEWT